jgi:hypothetical protein
MEPVGMVDATDQVGEASRWVSPEEIDVLFPGSVPGILRLCDAALVVDLEDQDPLVILLECKEAVLRRTLIEYAAFGRLCGAAVIGAGQQRLLDLARFLPELSPSVGGEQTRGLSLYARRIASLPHDLTDRLLGLAGLARGWDGYHAERVEHRTVERAIETLNHLYIRAADERVSLPAPVVGPTPDGSIQLEWDYPNAFLSVEIPAVPKPLCFYFERNDGEEAGKDVASLEDVWDIVEAELTK